MSHDNRFLDYAARERDSFLAFQENYVLMYPPPEKATVESDSQLVHIGIILIMVASTIASAVHTIPKFLEGVHAPVAIGWLVGASTFVMVELAVIVFSYTITRQRHMYDKSLKSDRVAWQKYAALFLSLAVAVIVNVYATVENAVALEIPIALQTLMTVLIGLCPPAMAYISGDILAQRWVEDQRTNYRLDVEFKRIQADYEKECRRSWRLAIGKENSAYAPIQLNSVNVQVNSSNGRPSANGNSKALTLEYLEQHPDDVRLTTDELKARVDEWSGFEVGRTNVYHAKTEFLKRQTEGRK